MPINTSTIGLEPIRGNLICLRWGHWCACLFQSMTRISPVTLLAVNASMCLLTVPPTCSSQTFTGVVSNVSTCPLNTFTVTLSVLSYSPNSAAMSALTYVFVLALSSNAFTFSWRFPFFNMTGTVLSPIKSGFMWACEYCCLWLFPI